MRLLVLAAAILVAAGFGSAYAAGAFGGDAQRPAAGVAPPQPDEAQLAAIRQLVLDAAAKRGDPTPTDGILIPTTRRLAELVDVDTAETDIPVYFALVHGDFEGGTSLMVTIDPTTNRALDTGLVGSKPDLNAIGTPEPLLLGTDPEQASNVPCATGHERFAGPKALRRFHAVTAVSCIDGTRTYPGRGQWSVRIRRVAVGGVAALQRYFEQPSRRTRPKGGGCLLVARFILVPTFVDGDGHWLVPRTPVDACGPAPGNGRAARHVHWRVVSVHRVRLMTSAGALAAHCAMSIKDLPAGGIGPLDPTAGGPLFRPAPETLRACIYRTPPNDHEVGNFVRGLTLDKAQTRRLLAAMTGAAPRGSCPDERTFAVVHARPELWAEVELGGCWRVGRTSSGYGLGSARASVVRAILGTG